MSGARRTADPRRTPKASYFLIAAELACFLAEAPDLPRAFSLLGFSALGLTRGEVWTLLTSMFVHVSIYHLGINIFFLYVFGTALEVEEGSGLLLGTFLLGGSLSLLVGIPFYPVDTDIVGSSIAVSAVVGASLVAIPDRKAPVFLFRAPLGLIAFIYLVFNAFLAYYAQATQGIAYPSHVIGFLVGAAVMLLARKVRGRRG